MVSYLQTVPNNVLTHIAFLSASSTPFDPPSDTLNLSFTSRDIFESLSVQHCPDLYAQLFTTRFDTAAPLRRFRSPYMLTSSSLCAEFVQRYRVMRRIRRRDMSGQGLAQDLFTVLMMLLESDGLNEMQLAVIGFPRYIITLLRTRLRQDTPPIDDVDSLAVRILSLTLSRQEISRLTFLEREEILTLLYPITMSQSRRPSDGGHSLSAISNSSFDRKVAHYHYPLTPAWTGTWSILAVLNSALNEACKLQIPHNLPPNRAIADAMQHIGPTTDDYSAMANFRTLLVADTCPSPPNDVASVVTRLDCSRSRLHDQDFSRLAKLLDPDCEIFRTDIPAYIPGALSGLWEGTWMQASLCNFSTSLSFLCRQPMQCFLREHLCFSPNNPLPDGEHSVNHVDDDSSRIWTLDPHQLTENQDGFDLDVDVPQVARKFCYERFLSGNELDIQGDHQREALDVVITGETLPDHDKAWGAYKFAGRVRLQDGLIVLKREPKNNTDDGLGTWYFKGYLHYGGSFAGRWYSSRGVADHRIEGIFSMAKGDGEVDV